jgi:ABC-type lipoprotein export system ATPase subunit
MKKLDITNQTVGKEGRHMKIVQFDKVSRVYISGDHELKALNEVELELDEGKFIVVLGPSGAGKSTLLNLLGGLDSPQAAPSRWRKGHIETIKQ